MNRELVVIPTGPWSAAETARLQGLLALKLSIQEIAQQLLRTRNAVGGRANRLGVRLNCRDVAWKSDEDAYLRKYWTSLSKSHIAQQLGRTKGSVAGRLKRLGLSRSRVLHRLDGGMMSAIRHADQRAKNSEARKALSAAAAPMKRSDYVRGTGVEFLALKPSQCKWPLNDPPRGEPFYFCGEKQWGKSSYCACHTERSWARFMVAATEAA